MTANLSVFYSNDIFAHTVPSENLKSFLTRLVKTLHFMKYVVDTHVSIAKSVNAYLLEVLICKRTISLVIQIIYTFICTKTSKSYH